MPPNYKLRAASKEDFEFYRDLHHEVFKKLVTPIWGWDPARQLEIVKKQFEPDKVQVIQLKKEDVGVVQIEERQDEIFLSQLWIWPEYQNQGIGSHIVEALIDKGSEQNLPVRLHVLRTNKAKTLYERFGFVEDGKDEGGIFMRKEPDAD